VGRFVAATGEVEGVERLFGGESSEVIEGDDFPLEVPEDAVDAVAVRALLGVDRERPGDDERSVAGAAGSLIGAEGPVLSLGGDRAEHQQGGIAESLDVGGEQVGFLDRQERREYRGDPPTASADLLELRAGGVEGAIDRRCSKLAPFPEEV